MHHDRRSSATEHSHSGQHPGEFSRTRSNIRPHGIDCGFGDTRSDRDHFSAPASEVKDSVLRAITAGQPVVRTPSRRYWVNQDDAPDMLRSAAAIASGTLFIEGQTFES